MRFVASLSYDQVLIRIPWHFRLVDGKSYTGLEVSFEAIAVVDDSTPQDQLEQGIQILFESKAKAFSKSFEIALTNETNGDFEPATEFSLEPARLPLGMGAIAVGCASLLALVIASARTMSNTRSDGGGDFNKTGLAITPENNDGITSDAYPMQQAAGQLQLNLDDVSFYMDIEHISERYIICLFDIL